MDRPRLFIGIPIDRSLAKKLMADLSGFALPWPKLKTVLPEQMHLTLKFLGETPLEQLPQIISVLDNLKNKTGPLDLIIDRAITISPQHPKVIALSLEKNPRLEKLQQRIEQTLWQAGLADKEMRKALPHLTLARIKQATRIEELKILNTWLVKKLITVNYFELIESVLLPRGPQYTTLQTFDL
ncbi:MAG: RNA 2',3'-cyclic phosphodiesterase [Patescibacteria group bacterium]